MTPIDAAVSVKRHRPSVTERLSYETPLWARGLQVAGMDEVGRGPLAGPVVVACVWLPPEPLIEGVDDSKKLSPKRRAALEAQILAMGRYAIAQVEAQEIDAINILQATKRGMVEAAQTLHDHMPQGIDRVLVDGNMQPDLCVPYEHIVHGDAVSYLIGAASIVAKEYRDRLMAAYHAQYPAYGFDQNKGYGTAAHMAALRAYGPCPIHRSTFIRHI